MSAFQPFPAATANWRTAAQPTGEIGPGVGVVPGEGGAGTSISGWWTGVSGGGWLGWPGC